MSYSIYIKSDKEIKETDIESIIEELPEFYRNFHSLKGSKQDWGWSLYTDIRLSDNKKELRVSGSFGMSGKHAEGMALQFMNGLLKRNYKVICESEDYEI